jgi:hypothetical protein
MDIKPQILCRDCKHFIPATMGLEYSLGDSYGKCKQFVRSNHDDVECNYEFAIYMRKNVNKCGKDAIYFQKKQSKQYNIFPE